MAEVSSFAEIDAYSRVPLLVLLVSAAVWLFIGSAFAFIASLKFHMPGFLADCSFLTYGRVRPAFTNSFLYGFCVQGGLGVAIWLFIRLGRNCIVQPGLLTLGASLWNLGLTAGVIGILSGDSTGFETLEIPGYASLMLFVAYAVIGVLGLLSLHQRVERGLYVSLWFIVAAVFWFPWIYSTAQLLLLKFPVRGVTQAVIAWWYANNLQMVWLGLVGLGLAFYFAPKLANRQLPSHYLAMFAFWTLILFATWGGIPNSAPVPAWLPALSTAGTVLLLIPIIAVSLSFWPVLGKLGPDASTPLRFIRVGVLLFVLAELLQVVSSLLPVSQVTDLTWFVPGRSLLFSYGFFAMILFGAIYSIMPTLFAGERLCPHLARAHYWLALGGIVLGLLPLTFGGIIQGLQIRHAGVPFMDVVKTQLMVIRISTLGDLCFLAGHGVFLVNVVALVQRFYKAKAATVFADATAEIKPVELRP